MPTFALGIRAVDDLTLEVETVEACHLFPEVMTFGFLLYKRALEVHGL